MGKPAGHSLCSEMKDEHMTDCLYSIRLNKPVPVDAVP